MAWLNRQRNKYVHAELSALIDKFQELFPSNSFVGDDMLISNRNAFFLDDPEFYNLFYECAKADMYKQMAWRLHVLDFFLSQSLKVPGDYVECGVFRGFKSYFLMQKHKLNMASRKCFLFDTFSGISEKYDSGSPIKNYEHNKRGLYEFVEQRFSEFENVIITKGAVPETLGIPSIDKVCFLHLDMNSWIAEISAMKYFLPKMTEGSVIILDDFGIATHKEQGRNEIPFLKSRDLKFLELPTGQAVVMI